MEEYQIIDMYNKGKSIEFITKEVYRNKNKYSRTRFFNGESWEYKKYNLSECRNIVECILIRYCQNELV